MILLNALRTERKRAGKKRSKDIRKSHPLLPLSGGTRSLSCLFTHWRLASENDIIWQKASWYGW